MKDAGTARLRSLRGYFCRYGLFFILHSSFLISLSSCSDDLLGDASGSVEEEVADGVYILTRVSDNSEGTRASISSTASWEGGSFDEVGISSLSVLFFKPDSTTGDDGSVSVSYTLARAFTTTVSSPSTTVRDTVTNSAGEKAIRWVVPTPPTSTGIEAYTQSSKTSITPSGSSTNVTPASVSEVPAWYKMYVIANHTWGSSDLTIGTTTPADLQKLLTNEDVSTAFSPSGSRDYGSFQMSDTLTGLNAMVDYTDGYGVTTRRDFEVSLQRALAKMCLRIYYAPTGATTYTQILHTGSATDTGLDRFHNDEHQFAFRLVQYAACTPLTLDGTGSATVYSLTGTEADTVLSLYDQSSDNITVPSTDQHTLYSLETTSTDDDGNTTTTREDACVVYYLYPNNWADSAAIANSSLNTDAPIIEDRQTYLEMQIKYTPSSTRTVTYTYEIPTNYLLPEYNDAVSLTDAQKEELYSAYRIDRNTAYWANVYVSEVEAGLRVALSTGSGSSAAIADLEDDPSVVNLEATSTTLTISDFGDGTGDGKSYSLSAGDSIAAFTLGSTTTVDDNGDTITVTNSEGIDSDGNYYQQITTTAQHDATSSATTTTLSGNSVTYGTVTGSSSSRRRSASDKTIYFTSATQSEYADSTLVDSTIVTRTYASDLGSYTITTNSIGQSLTRVLWTSVSTDSLDNNYTLTYNGTTYTGTKFKEIDYTRYRYYEGFGDPSTLTALVDGITTYTTTDSINVSNSTRNANAASITISDTTYAVPSLTTTTLTDRQLIKETAYQYDADNLISTINEYVEGLLVEPTSTSSTTYPDTTLTFYEGVDLSSITSVTSNSTSYTVSGSTCTCGGTLTIKYTSDSSWTASSSTSYTAATSSDTNTGEGGESSGGDTTGGSTFSGGGSSARRAGEGTIDDTTGDGNSEGGTNEGGTTSNTATISSITCTTTYTGTGQSTYTPSATIRVTYTLSGTGDQTSTATATYTSTDLKTWTESTSSARRRRKR